MELSKFYQQARIELFDLFGNEDGRLLWNAACSLSTDIVRVKYLHNVIKSAKEKMAGVKQTTIHKQALMLREVVGVREFVQSPEYLDKEGQVYPYVLDELERMNSDQYQEIVLTGGIGSAKTTCALYTTAYQVYLLSCMRNPHEVFGLDSSSEILFVFQSINGKISKASFERFRSMIEGSKYFSTYFKPDKDIGSKLVFPNRIEVVPVSGAETAAIGQNVIGGFLDELNYMQVTERSKQSVDGGTYDQAVALYNSIARRRKSRFMKAGAMPGKLCLVSSKRYPGQFTDLKEEEAKRDNTIYIYDKRVWDIKPEGSFSGKWFRVFTGTEDRKPRVLTPNEHITEDMNGKVMSIPVEFREDFDKDIVNALREIAGVSTLARHPYFIDVERVKASFGKHESVFAEQRVDFVETPLILLPKKLKSPELPRYAHIDLAVTGDSAGVTIGTVFGFKSMLELGMGTSEELVPQVHIDGILEVAPPKNGEILFWKIRNTLVKLRDLGLNIKWISFDSYQSRDSIQLLRQQGFSTGMVSVDTSTEPYDLTKTVIYSGSLSVPEHLKCRKELISLEKIARTGKIDHPANGSKDCSDSLAGVVYGLYHRREIWSLHGIPMMQIYQSKSKAEEDKND
jgi:hypothetical protein